MQVIADRYAVIKTLGDGASGVVSLGKDTRTGEKVAIKTPKMADRIYGMAYDHLGCMKTAARNYREVKILKSLQHPNIIKLKDMVCPIVSARREHISRMMEEHQHREAFKLFSSMHLVFEYMNTDLCKLMESSVFLTVPQALSVSHQLLSAVEYMHSANVIHRDIKPENVLVLVSNGGQAAANEMFILNAHSTVTVKLADFGLARTVESQDILLRSRAAASFSSPRKGRSPPDPAVAFACSDIERLNTPSLLPASSVAPSTIDSIASKAGKQLLERPETGTEELPTPPLDSESSSGLGPALSIGPPLPGPVLESADLGSVMPHTDLPLGSALDEDNEPIEPAEAAIPMYRAYSDHVLTRWYRAPEVILGEHYQSAVDVWAVGCVLIDVLNLVPELVPSFRARKSLFQGSGRWGKLSPSMNNRREFIVDDGVSIMSAIFNLIGTPTEEEASKYNKESQNVIKNFRFRNRGSVRKHFIYSRSSAFANPVICNLCDLIDSCMKFVPGDRVRLDQAVDHIVFQELERDETQPRQCPVQDQLRIEAEDENENSDQLCASFIDLVDYFDRQRIVPVTSSSSTST